MGQTVAVLELLLGLSTSGARDEAARFGDVVDKTTAAAIGNYRKLEKASEAMILSLNRQELVFGKSRDQVQGMKVEALALAATANGMTELAGRLQASARALDLAKTAAAEAAAEEARLAAETRAAAAAFDAFERAAAAGAARWEQRVAGAQRYAASLEADVAALGRTSAEMRQAAIAAKALDAAQAGLHDEAARITAAGDAYARYDAQLVATAAAAKALAGEHQRLAAAVQASHAADVENAASLERLRRSVDPTRAAIARLNAELEEATRLYRAGVTGEAEYARQQSVLAQRLNATRAAQDAHTNGLGAASAAAKRGSGSMTQFSFQLNDVATMASLGAKPMQIFASQAGQIFQIAQMAEGGVKGFAMEVGGLALRFAPVIGAAAIAGVAIHGWQKQLNEDAGMKKFVSGLGLTDKELRKLGNQSVTTGDILAGVWKTISDGVGLSGQGKSILDRLISPDDVKQVETFVAQIYGVFVGGFNAIVDLWGQVSPAIGGFLSSAAQAAMAFFQPVIAGAQWVAKGVGQIFSALYDLVAGWVRSLGQWISPILQAIGLDKAAAAVSSAGSAIGNTFGSAYTKAVKQAMGGMDGFVASAGANAIAHAKAGAKAKADAIIADRTPKTDKSAANRAAQLQREAEATEAQIRNLYKLAGAYNVSDAAALEAEARVKAESAAITKRGDIEAFVSRQISLAVAQRVADAAKAAAAMRSEAEVQGQVNDQVAAGLLPQARAADAVRDRLAMLPLLAAQQAALSRGDVAGAAAATAALFRQTEAQQRLNAERVAAQFGADQSAGRDQLATLKEELRLIGATDAARVHALATLKATQEAAAKGYDPAQAKVYIDQQARLADLSESNRVAADNYNESLRYQAELLDTVDQNAQNAARGMADAFGEAGRAIGDVVTTLTGYASTQQRLADDRAAQVKAAGGDAQRLAQIETLYAARSATAQVGLYGDIASAAKGFFDERSKGYKVLAAAEKAFRLVELAMAVKNAAVQIGLIGGVTAAKVGGDAVMAASDTARSGVEQANSLATGAIKAAEAVVNAIRSLPFPLNIAAGAATAAVVASLGFAIGGAFGGGGAKPAASNSGTGTVLGDSSAKSDSIKGAIDLLKQVDDATLSVSREMLASLRSIEANIGGLTKLLIRTGNINASAGVTTGFKTDGTGQALSGIVDPLGIAKSIPVLGDILSGIGGVVKSLFGTKTSVVASGLFGGPQTIADVLNAGFDASYFSDVKKTKKFLGVSTGAKYSTQYAGADGEIEQQFGLILKGFYDTIAAAAPALGQATGDVEDRLSGFVVDIGKIDLQGLKGDEIQEKLTAVFGAAADDMARAALPGLEKFQAVGEGYFETLARVASTVEQVGASLGRLGANAQGLAVDASMGLAGLFDSVGDLGSAADAYFADFYSEAEQTAAKTAQMAKAFGSLGLAMPDSIATYRQLVDAQDLNTAAGQSTYAVLLQLAPAFADLNKAVGETAVVSRSAADVASERADLERRLLEAQGDSDAIRALDLAKLDASNRALQEHIWALQDEQAAAQAAATAAEQAAAAELARIAAVANERAGLERTLLQAQGDTAALRQLELAGLDQSNRAIQERIYALQDEQAAAQAAAQAEAEAAAKALSIANERAGLDRQILELTGDTVAIRERDVAALDSSNQALQRYIYGLQDQQAATAAAEQAAAEAATRAQAVASERAGLEQQLLQLQGDTAALRAIELAGLDATNRGLQERVYALQDEQAAAERAQAIAGERAGLDRQILQLAGDTVALRQIELAALDPANRALQERIYAIQDEQAATAAAAAAAADAAQRLKTIVDERAGLDRQLLQLQGNTAALRALELAGLDASNRALQEQIYALQDAQEAAKAADQLREAWQSVGDTIMDEVKRIRGLADGGAAGGGYASLLGQFDAATAAARGGDQVAAKSLPELSKALLEAAALAATSRQELARIEGVTAASLERTYGFIAGATSASAAATAGTAGAGAGVDQQSWWQAFARSQGAAPAAANDELVTEVRNLRAELAGLREDQRAGDATVAANTGKVARILDRVTTESGGNAIATQVAA